MKEEKILLTTTTVSRNQNLVNIFTYFSGSIRTLIAFFASKVENIDGIAFKENELGFSNKGYADIQLQINNNGELLITADSSKSFTINGEGELIMEEPG
jgi:ATP-dependent protease HslVU (ClpYQ) peptidase subunit